MQSMEFAFYFQLNENPWEGVLSSYCCSNKLPQTQELETTHIFILSQFWRLEIRNDSQWAKIKVSTSFLEAVGENPFPCVFQLLGSVCIPSLMAPFNLQSLKGPV